MKKLLLICLLVMLFPSACAVTYYDVAVELGIFTYTNDPLCAFETVTEIDGMQYFFSKSASSYRLCRPAEGILSDVVADLDGDGSEELLMIYTRPAPDGYSENRNDEYKTVCMRAYDVDGENLTLLDDVPLFVIVLDSFTVRLVQEEGRTKILAALHDVIYSGDGQDYISAALYSFDGRFNADWVTCCDNTGVYLLAENVDDHRLIDDLHKAYYDTFDPACLEPYVHTFRDYDEIQDGYYHYSPEPHRFFREKMQALGLECIIFDPDDCPYFQELIGGGMVVSHEQFYAVAQYRTGAAAQVLAENTLPREPQPLYEPKGTSPYINIDSNFGELSLRPVSVGEFSIYTAEAQKKMYLQILADNYSREAYEADPETFREFNFSNETFSYDWLNEFEKQNLETLAGLLNLNDPKQQQ